MIQGFASPGCAIDMLIQFRESCFQISLVKIPSYNECSLRICGFQFAKSQIKFVQSHRCVCLGGNIYGCDYNRREFPCEPCFREAKNVYCTELCCDQNTPLVDLTSNSQRSRGELKQAMDIFSAGCVIAELFTEGVPLFDLSQLLAYRKGHFQTEHVLMKIEDHYIRELVAQMVQREPEKRLTAEEYLKQQRGNAFPDIFYTFLQPYKAQFAKETFQSADERVLVIRKDLDNILHNLREGGSGGSTEKPEKGDQESSVVSTKEDQGLVVLVSVITSCLQTLRSCDSKLAALELVLHLAGCLRVETLLDRITPYLLHFCSDLAPRVRAQAVRTLAKVLALVKEVPRNDVNIYPEYILPGIAHLAQDDDGLTMTTENIAHLAETALRFLELVQENYLNMEHDLNGEDTEETLHPNENYDSELQALHEMVQQKVVTLLSDSENIVKQSLMENGITRLCVFFGRQKANDVLLSHMITFLNDKNDWHLRGAFFDSIVGKCYVLYKLCHFVYILISYVYTVLDTIYCILPMPLCTITHSYIFMYIFFIPLHLCCVSSQIDKEIVLLSVLKEPVSRSIFDYSLRSKDIASLFRHLLLRQKKRSGSLPECPIPEDPAIAQLLKKLLSQGMTEAEEDKLLALKDFMLKSNKAKANMGDQSHLGEAVQSGVIDLATLGIMGRQVDLVKPKQEAEDKRDFIATASARKHTKQDSNMNEEWKSMFGSQESAATVPEGAGTQTRKTTASLGVPVGQSAGAVSTYQRRLNTCKAELQHLVQQKREQCSAERMAKQMMESAEWESRWPPKGLLVAHLHEHKSAVNRIRVSDEHSIFATASNDGTVKVWDSQKMEGKTTTTRYANQITLTFCQGSHYLAAASDNGSIQLLAIEANKSPKSPKVNPFQTRLLHQKDDGCVVDVHHFNSGAQSVLCWLCLGAGVSMWVMCGKYIPHHNIYFVSLIYSSVSLIWAATGMPTAGKGTIWAAYAPNIGYSLFRCGHRQSIEEFWNLLPWQFDSYTHGY
uniref:non-specific serine/threonine protein kinase n=1 Tax=Oncorhynchus tshawytscha TaxID=74940 RepID=A0AAZ3QJQ8_ONCTS